MNIYEKMQEMRVELQESKVKKTGKNQSFGYFELHDILPTINNLLKKHKVTSEIGFDREMVCLRVINSEKPDEIMTFTAPFEMASIRNCHATQNLGATITYIRRYLYINAFEVVEHDALDKLPMDKAEKSKAKEDSVYKQESVCPDTNSEQLAVKNKVTGDQKANIYNYLSCLDIENIMSFPEDDPDYAPVVNTLQSAKITSVEDLDFAFAERLEKFLSAKHEEKLQHA